MTVAIRQLSVPRHHRTIPQGQSVAIIATIEDVGLTSVLLSPSNVPLISVYNPSDIALFTDREMTLTSSPGIYTAAVVTTASHALGLYTGTVTVVHMDQVARIEKVTLFKIITATAFVTFTYMAIQDQGGTVWYWYVGSDNTLTVSATVPSVLGKQATLITMATVPHWLQISNPTPAVRYIYPSLAGEPTVTATQPSVGAGMVGSPTFAGVTGTNWTIALNISDEVILNAA